MGVVNAPVHVNGEGHVLLQRVSGAQRVGAPASSWQIIVQNGIGAPPEAGVTLSKQAPTPGPV